MISVGLADDHPVVLSGLEKLINSAHGLQLVGTGQSGTEILKIIDNKAPNVVLCDINMPAMSGFDLLEHLKGSNTASRIIVLSVHEEKAIIQRAYKLGAYGYLLKSSSHDEIIEAIHQVQSGKKYFSNEVMEITMSTGNLHTEESKLELLSTREKEIVILICDGLSNVEIGEKLFISKRTVDAHRNNVLQKLQLKNTAQLVRFAIQSDLIG